jgi:hypothetical protein
MRWNRSTTLVSIFAASVLMFGVILPFVSGETVLGALGTESAVGSCSTVGGQSTVGGESTVGAQSTICGTEVISGTVTNVGGTPLGGICVTAIPVDGGSSQSATTSVDGTYAVESLAPGSYRVEFTSGCGSSADYGAQYFNGSKSGALWTTDATAIAITDASPATGIDAVMGAQVVTFSSTAPAHATVNGDSYTPAATSTSGLAVTISLDANSGGCSMHAGAVSFIRVGTCVLDANQAGNSLYHGADQVLQSFAVNPGAQSALSVATLVGTLGSALTLSTRGGSGTGKVTYSVTDGSATGCSLSGDQLCAKKIGTCVVTATKAGDSNYLAAASRATKVTFSATRHHHA